MRVESWLRRPECLVLTTTAGQIKIEPRTPAIVHVVYTLAAEFSCKASLAVLPSGMDTVAWDVQDLPGSLELWTDCVRVLIDKETVAFTYTDRHGAVLAQEPRRGGKTLVPADIVRTVSDESTELRAESGADGVRVRMEHGRQVFDRTAYHAKLEFVWAVDEALYGLGSHEDGIMNLRGTHQYLYQQNMKAVVPVLVSTNGYAIVVDCCSLMTFHDDVYGSYLWSDVVDELDYYFVYGPEFDQIIGGYRRLTGRAPMPPKWSFGYLQSKERYQTQEELIAIVREYRKRRIPLDAIVLDWHSWSGDYWGQKTLDPLRFPEPATMVSDLHAMHAKLMVSIWPIMSADGPNQIEMREAGCLLGNQATYNAFDARARALYWRQADNGLFQHGVDAWWCDCTEPFEADWQGATRPEPEERLRINTEEAKAYLDPDHINAYSLLHSQGIYEGQRDTTQDKRVLNLTRSSFAGQHRYGTITWSGDISATWETFRKQIPAGLNFCVTGEPYWTVDVGGFFTANREQWFWAGDYDLGCEDHGFRELYVRWFQYATFLPMLRAHGTDTPREIWRFGEPGSQTFETLLKFVHLRYRLLPYIYSMAGWVTLHGYTMLRALAFDFPDDPRVRNIADQFMFGPALLVCPVTTAMYHGVNSTPLQGVARTRDVYLPSGCAWYDFWTRENYQGGQTIIADAPLDRLPLYVQAGSILPLGPVVQHTGEPQDPIELCVYAGADCSFEFYDDEGDNYNYERGAYESILFEWKDNAGTLAIGERTGCYTRMRQQRRFRVVLISAEQRSGTGETARTVEYEGSRVVLPVRESI